MLRLPRIRFLLAVDPGAGKTIMAGLLMREHGPAGKGVRPVEKVVECRVTAEQLRAVAG